VFGSAILSMLSLRYGMVMASLVDKDGEERGFLGDIFFVVYIPFRFRMGVQLKEKAGRY